MNKNQAEAYTRMMITMVDQRIVELHEGGLSVEEIHERMTPRGDLYPSQVSGVINKVIVAWKRHVAIDAEKQTKGE